MQNFISNTERRIMASNGKTEKPFIFRFIDTQSTVLLELTNETDHTLKSIEILTVFLKDEEALGRGPSQAHIRFDVVDSMKPKRESRSVSQNLDQWKARRYRSRSVGKTSRSCRAFRAPMCWIFPGKMRTARRAFNGYQSAIDLKSNHKLNNSRKRNYVCGLTHGRLSLLSPF